MHRQIIYIYTTVTAENCRAHEHHTDEASIYVIIIYMELRDVVIVYVTSYGERVLLYILLLYVQKGADSIGSLETFHRRGRCFLRRIPMGPVFILGAQDPHGTGLLHQRITRSQGL